MRTPVVAMIVLIIAIMSLFSAILLWDYHQASLIPWSIGAFTVLSLITVRLRK